MKPQEAVMIDINIYIYMFQFVECFAKACFKHIAE